MDGHVQLLWCDKPIADLSRTELLDLVMIQHKLIVQTEESLRQMHEANQLMTDVTAKILLSHGGRA